MIRRRFFKGIASACASLLLPRLTPVHWPYQNVPDPSSMIEKDAIFAFVTSQLDTNFGLSENPALVKDFAQPASKIEVFFDLDRKRRYCYFNTHGQKIEVRCLDDEYQLFVS